MTRVSVSYAELRQLATRLRTRSDALDAEVGELLLQLRRLEGEWTGGRTASLAEALATAERGKGDLAAALNAIAAYLMAAIETYEALDSALTSGLGHATADIPAVDVFELNRKVATDTTSTADVSGRWRVPVGVLEDGEVATIDFASGGNTLVAGSTGSGKSQLLRTVIAGLATRFTPREVSLVLVDFKGGGAFAGLNELPHVVATLSALDGRYVRRWLRQLQAAVRKREDAQRTGGHQALIPERLVVIVDEFSAWDDPDLLADLGAAVRSGRSLGIHVLLGAQTLGFISNTLRSIVDTRIALRVQSREASIEALGVAGAERLSGSGEALLVDAGAPPKRFRVAAHLNEEDVRSVIAGARTHALHLETPTPWPPPLPAVLALSDIPRTPEGAIAIGLVDMPDRLEQMPLLWNPVFDGHLLVVGPPGSGKTSTLAKITKNISEQGEYELVTLSTAADGRQTSAWRGRELRDLDSVVRSLRASARSQMQHRILVVDALDEMPAADDASLSSIVIELIELITREWGGGVSLLASSRKTRFGDRDLGPMFGVVVELAPWNQRQSSSTPLTPATSRVPGRGLWNGYEVQLFS